MGKGARNKIIRRSTAEFKKQLEPITIPAGTVLYGEECPEGTCAYIDRQAITEILANTAEQLPQEFIQHFKMLLALPGVKD